MGRKECLISYVDPSQNLVCFRLTTENTIKSLGKVLEYAQYLKKRTPDQRIPEPEELLSSWMSQRFWYLISDLKIISISRSQFRSIPSASAVRYHNTLANVILRYGRSHWDRRTIKNRMKRGY